ncbi:hypothetical protein, partial [Vibrio splendidus]|uniref:hypothetical protein n=1 Tax=Vibrio splendidus TaxID=29497 RepID=UPI001A7E0FE3
YVSSDGIINNLVQIQKELDLFLVENGQLVIKKTIDPIDRKALLKESEREYDYDLIIGTQYSISASEACA